MTPPPRRMSQRGSGSSRAAELIFQPTPTIVGPCGVILASGVCAIDGGVPVLPEGLVHAPVGFKQRLEAIEIHPDAREPGAAPAEMPQVRMFPSRAHAGTFA